MNKKEIEKKYPKAFKLADEKINYEWAETDRIGIAWDFQNEIRGYLYDFFDEQGIIIYIYDSEPWEKERIFSISVGYVDKLLHFYRYKTRKEAEEQAF